MSLREQLEAYDGTRHDPRACDRAREHRLQRGVAIELALPTGGLRLSADAIDLAKQNRARSRRQESLRAIEAILGR